MALSFLTPKVLCAEVTAGVDLESGVMLTGERITIGSGPGDTLRLGARHVVPAHLTFQRQKAGRGWEYFTTDRGHTAVDTGNPRTGPVRPGMSFVLGGETRIDILRRPAPPDMAKIETGGGEKTVPLAVALPMMGAMVVAFGLYIGNLSNGAESSGLRTTPWFTGAADLEPPLDACLASGLSPEARALAPRTDSTEPDALFRAYLSAAGADPAEADIAKSALLSKVRGLIAESHLLLNENKAMQASRTLRRLEYVLPVGNGDCPILSAARLDLAILELRGGQP